MILFHALTLQMLKWGRMWLIFQWALSFICPKSIMKNDIGSQKCFWLACILLWKYMMGSAPWEPQMRSLSAEAKWSRHTSPTTYHKQSQAKEYLQPVVLERLRHQTSGLVHTKTMFLQMNAHYIIRSSSAILTAISSLTVSKPQSVLFLSLCNWDSGQQAEML